MIVGRDLAFEIVDSFINTEYEPTAEKDKMIEKLMAIEEKYKDDEKDQVSNEKFFDEFIEKWDRGEYHD